MTTEAQNTQLLEDFQKYLQQSKSEPLITTQQPDLNTLLGELTALKTEVKAESRQFKNTLDTLSSALNVVENDNKALTAELATNNEQLAQQQAEIKRTMLLEMVELYDRLSTGTDVLENYQPVNKLFKKSTEKDIKFTSDSDGPLRLVYASSSFTEEKVGPMLGIFIYEVNKDYKLLS